MKSLRIATRKSQLALCQAELVKQALLKHFPDLKITFVPLTTSGDQQQTRTLAAVGGKGLFTKEIEEALLQNHADIAVHSMKDMPVHFTPHLTMAALLEREDPRDVFVSLKYNHLSEMQSGNNIGTASLRRQFMIKQFRQDLILEVLRGNVNTRLSKLAEGLHDAIILAAAGLKRLNMAHHIQHYFSIEESLPAIGQGIIGVQCRENATEVKKYLLLLDHLPSRLCLTAERALNAALGGNCQAPIGGYAQLKGDNIQLKACVYSADGAICIKSEKIAHKDHAEQLGKDTATALFLKGADQLLKNLR